MRTRFLILSAVLSAVPFKCEAACLPPLVECKLPGVCAIKGCCPEDQQKANAVIGAKSSAIKGDACKGALDGVEKAVQQASQGGGGSPSGGSPSSGNDSGGASPYGDNQAYPSQDTSGLVPQDASGVVPPGGAIPAQGGGGGGLPLQSGTEAVPSQSGTEAVPAQGANGAAPSQGGTGVAPSQSGTGAVPSQGGNGPWRGSQAGGNGAAPNKSRQPVQAMRSGMSPTPNVVRPASGVPFISPAAPANPAATSNQKPAVIVAPGAGSMMAPSESKGFPSLRTQAVAPEASQPEDGPVVRRRPRLTTSENAAQDMTELENPDARATKTASTTDLGDLPTLNDAVIGEMAMPGSRAEVAPGSPMVEDADVSLTDRARASLKAGDSKTAIRLLRQVLAVNPGDAEASALLATAYNREHDYRAALAAANAGLGVSLDNVPLLDAKAYALNRLKDFRGALAAADRAAALKPRDALAQFNRAIALAGLGDRVGALEALRAAASLSPTFVPYLEAAGKARGADLKFLLEDDYDLAGQTPLSRRIGWWILGVVAAGACVLAPIIVLRLRRRRAVAAPAAKRPAPGVLAGRYELGREVGTDGMGVVHEGMDAELDRRVVIKRMREEVCADERQRRGFVSEARTAAQLRHPHIVELLEIVEAEGEVYLVFEHVGGRTLEQRIAEGRLPFAEARALFVQAASALDYAHAHGVLHRGLRPSNIMVDEDGLARLKDFGVTVAGAPPYLAPEQEQGKARGESDVYALAVCLYEALTGEKPFDGIDAGLSMNKLNKVYAPASKVAKGLPAYIDIFFARAFEPDPTKRHSSAGALMGELEGLK